ncbi:MAG: site-specific integrase [Pseudodesulfovibrio sp.]|nr:site-specific integrase [Pseudodesulfovibrio sp.]
MPYREGRKWRGAVRYTPFAGKQLRRTMLFDKQKDAKSWERETTKALELADRQNMKDMNTVGRALTTGRWAELYMDFVQTAWTEKTYDAKRRAFKRLFRDSIRPTLPVGEITPAMALDHLSKLKRRKNGNTANKDRMNLVAAWNWGIKYHNLDRLNPFQLVDRFPEKRHPRYVPPFDDFIAVLDIADRLERLILLCTFYTAARKSEVFRIKWSEVNFAKTTVGLWTQKRRGGDWEFDEVPMAESLKKLLAERKLEAGKSEYVFDQSRWMVRDCHSWWLVKLCKKAEIKKFGFHGMRHLAASIGIDAGANILDIQQLLRHKSTTTTERYIHRVSKNNIAVNALDEALKSRHALFDKATKTADENLKDTSSHEDEPRAAN